MNREELDVFRSHKLKVNGANICHYLTQKNYFEEKCDQKH